MPELFPELFAETMRRLLKDDYEDFSASFLESRKNALRVNRLKDCGAGFEASAPFPVTRVPWTDNGYYVDYRDKPGQHPWYRAGVYYLQEPSAMAPAQILPVSPGDRVLDLCAAPGGKATEIGARLAGEGILIANEISASRARALERNIELFGIRNCVVTNEPPARLAQRFAAYFDRILVDAPCSGEGMFRKDPDAVRKWSAEKVKECAAIQRELILKAADMLRPSGYMVYSTCTFEPEENELVIAHLLRERPDMELAEISCTGGRETFSRAYTLQELADRGYGTGTRERTQHGDRPGMDLSKEARTDPVREAQSARSRDPQTDAPEGVRMDLSKAVRIWPHLAKGEGHFIALIRKKAAARPEAPVPARGAKKSKDGKKQQKSPLISRKDRELVSQFLSRYAAGLKADWNRIEIRNDHVYQLPEDCPDLRGLKFLRAGLYLGELRKNRFEPSQELALALPGVVNCPGVDDGIHIRFSSEDERLYSFLRGESVLLENSGENGWRIVCADVYPAGWGKLVSGMLKNHIPPAWRAHAVLQKR